MRVLSYYDESRAAPAAGTHPHLQRETDRLVRALAGGRLRRILRAVPASIITHQKQFITIKPLYGDPAEPRALRRDGRTECVVVDSASALDAVAGELCPSFRDSIAELKARLAQGCVVSVARRARGDGRGVEVVGYEIAERGVFSALGRRLPVADDVIFSHYVEVLPAYRGQRIHQQLFATRDAYFRDRGGRVVCGVCAPHNQASMRALRRDGAIIVGTVERVLLLRAFIVWYTPFERIAQLLR